jgi:hypothetical protein
MKSPQRGKNLPPRSLDEMTLIKTRLDSTYSHQMSELLIDFLSSAQIKKKRKQNSKERNHFPDETQRPGKKKKTQYFSFRFLNINY